MLGPEGSAEAMYLGPPQLEKSKRGRRRTRERRTRRKPKEGSFIRMGGNQRYILLDKLDTGTYSKVYRCQDRKKDRVVAIKKQRLYHHSNPMAVHEMAIQQFLSSKVTQELHPGAKYIVRYLDSYADIELGWFYTVMEYTDRGTLLSRLSSTHKSGYFPEWRAQQYFHDLALAVDCMHSLNVAHRDLKLENALLFWDEEEGREVVKVCDFGFSKMYNSKDLVNDSVGSQHYAAPELIITGGALVWKPDVWALGVCLFGLVHSVFPFESEHHYTTEVEQIRNMHDKIVLGLGKHLYMHVPKGYSDALNNLFDRIFVSPEQRLSVKGILSHPWLANRLIPPRVRSDPRVMLVTSHSEEYPAFNDYINQAVASSSKSPPTSPTAAPSPIAVEELDDGQELSGSDGPKVITRVSKRPKPISPTSRDRSKSAVDVSDKNRPIMPRLNLSVTKYMRNMRKSKSPKKHKGKGKKKKRNSKHTSVDFADAPISDPLRKASHLNPKSP